jgi:hypothetical protein
MTDALRPNPLGLPLDPDPTLPSEGPDDLPEVDAPRDPIDDPVVWPTDRQDAPDDRGEGSLDLPGEAPALEPAPG